MLWLLRITATGRNFKSLLAFRGTWEDVVRRADDLRRRYQYTVAAKPADGSVPAFIPVPVANPQ